MSDYISKKRVYRILTDLMTESGKEAKIMLSDAKAQIHDEDGADVIEVGLITCLGIKFLVEGDTIKVKWRHWDKHYIVSFGRLLELWEKYIEEEQENE